MTEDQISQHAGALTGVGGWLLDGTTLQLTWTAQTYRLHGLGPAGGPLHLDTGLALVDPPDQGRVREALLTALHRGCGCDLTAALALPDGSRPLMRWVADFQRRADGTGQLLGAMQRLPQAPPQARDASLDFAVAAAGVGVWEVDLVTGEERWSDQTRVLYGLPSGAPTPTRAEWHTRFVHPDDRARVDERAAEFNATGRPYEVDFRAYRANDGALRWMHSRAVFAAGGQRRVLGVTLDITDEREAEERARQATQLLDHAAAQVGFGFGYRDADSEQAHWSPQLKRLFGLSPQMPTPSMAETAALVSEHDRARVMRSLTAPIAPGELREFEFEVSRGVDGGPRSLTSRVMTEYRQGRAVRTYVAVVDLTDLRRKDRQVDELLTRLQMATEASGVGTWERDARTGRSQWDAITLALFDLPPGSLALDRPEFLARIHRDDRERVARALARADAESAALDVDYRVQRPDGNWRWLRTRGRVVHGDDGQLQRSVGVVFDTTAQREAEVALQARALAEQANAAKTEFLSRMSHELRTPLNAVLGFAQLLSLDHADPLSASQRTRVDHIQAAGWHLLALVNDVLDLSRIESRQAQLVYSQVPVADVVSDCISMAAPLAQAQQVGLHAPVCDPGLRAWADATRLKQVLLNLVSNAVKYNRPGGRVDVVVQVLPSQQVAFSVRDTGAGLTPEQLVRLFEPFNRLGRETSAIEGTGLGLALSKLLVEQMGGSISASSTPGLGSEFRFSVPLAAS